MFKSFIFIFTFIAFALIAEEETPKFLYKVVSLDAWKQSQNQTNLKLNPKEQKFTRLFKEKQLDRVIHKKWAKQTNYVILKIDTSKISGRLVYEMNRKGTHMQYHLYGGSIPLKAVVETKGAGIPVQKTE